ncbi:MAG: C39 family peptidase [Candidatus Krumholzibacteriia bacterium]
MAAVAGAGPAPAGPPAPDAEAPAALPLLDVPYVPQSGQLCGGAALAMVLRFWGEAGVRAEDFAALVEPGEDGIRTGILADAARARGWTALPLAATRAAVTDQLARGRPVIALLEAGAGSFHYVVLLAWPGTEVVLHDPNRGPFRVVPEATFTAAWAGSGHWALLVLPAPGRLPAAASAPGDAAVSDRSAVTDACGALVQEGIRLAAQGDSAAAEHALAAAQALCPGAAAPLRERAGLRFRAGDWSAAERLAGQALALDPRDTLARRLQAGSRFLAGDLAGALEAWNHLDEPRLDLVRIDGLGRTRYAVVAAQLGLPPDRLLTPQDFRRAGRRLAELPARAGSRFGYTPLPAGAVRVDVVLWERPLLGSGPRELLRLGARALVDREVTVAVAGPTGNGELWQAAWRWWPDRPRVALELAAPALGGRPGIWRVGGFWERQTYAAGIGPGAGGAPPGEPIREERRRTAVSFTDWWGTDLRLGIAAALDRWEGRGAHLALEVGAERRWARDRLTVGVTAAGWQSIEGRDPFAAGSAVLRWRSGGPPGLEAWWVDLGLSTATVDAPLALWSGAGTGHGRAPLLRAHPLLDGGVITGSVFGRSLAHATVERQAWPWRQGLLQAGWAVFLDGARAGEPGSQGSAPWQVDGGAGLRLRGLGTQDLFRLDLARGFRDGDLAVSAAWRRSF